MLVQREQLYQEVVDFLYKEAELLDEGRYREWLGMLTDDIRYQVPIRVTRERESGAAVPGVVEDMFHLDEDFASLEMRILRIETGFAWAEDPPSRLRHFVTNVRVGEFRGTENEVDVRSNVLLFRNRWDRPEYDLLSCERFDVLRRVNGVWKLARRKVLLDTAVVPTLNLSFFF